MVWVYVFFGEAHNGRAGSGDAMDRDGVKQLLVEVHADCQVMLALESNHWLEGFERLDRSLEAD